MVISRNKCFLVVLVLVVLAAATMAEGNAGRAVEQPNVAQVEVAVNQDPVAWPSETIGSGGWTVYTQLGSHLEDPSAADGDCSTGGTKPSGATDIVRGDPPYYPSALWAYDPVSQVFFYRIRVAGMPLTSGGENSGARTGGDPWTNVKWNMLIDADNDGWKEFTIVLDGDSGGKAGSDIGFEGASNDGDDLKIYFSNLASQCVTPETVSGNVVTVPGDLVWWGNAGTKNASVPASPAGDGATWDFGRTRCVLHTTSNATWGRGYFVDFQFPVPALTDGWNNGLGGTPIVSLNTPLAFGYGTSNSNQDPLQKDYATNFCYTAGCDVRFPYSDIVTLGEGTATAPIIGAMDLSAIDCPSQVTVRVAVASALQVVPPYTGGGVVDDTIATVLFQYYLDADADGMEDDGSSWLAMSVVDGMAPNPDVDGNRDPANHHGVFNDWGVVWNTSSLAEGQYLIRVTAVNDVGASAAKVVGSYILASGSCRPGPNLSWVSYSDALHALPCDLFGNYPDTTVYMAGFFESYTAYVVAFYDAGGVLVGSTSATSGAFGFLGGALTLVISHPVGLYHAVVFPGGTSPPDPYSPVGAVADDTFFVRAGLLRNADVTQLSPQDPPNSELFFQAHPLEPAIDPSVARYQEKFTFTSGSTFPNEFEDLHTDHTPLIFYDLVGYTGDTLRVVRSGDKIVITY